MNSVLRVNTRRTGLGDGYVGYGDRLRKRLRKSQWMLKRPQLVCKLFFILGTVWFLTVMLILYREQMRFHYQMTFLSKREVHDLVAGEDILDGVCVGWQSSSGEVHPCKKRVSNSEDGHCLVEDVATKRLYRSMKGRKGGLTQTHFRCEEFAVDFLEFKIQVNRAIAGNSMAPRLSLSRNVRGVVMSVHMGVLLIAVGSIQRLRAAGCHLPVEIFYLEGELDESHPLTKKLFNLGDIRPRIVEDRSYFRYYSKIYAVIHSSFNDVLLLDSDNIVARNPEYLFDAPEYKAKGAIFWPDHWHPNHSPLFKLDHTSLAWELFGIPFVNSFEQESGQLLINRNIAYRAFPILDSYIQNADLIEKLKVAWGDKELFRFAFMRAGLSFHMVQTPPGLAGFYFFGTSWPWPLFCGQTLVQHAPSGEIVFFHRNTRKIGAMYGWGSHRTWTHVREYTGKRPDDYRAKPSMWWCGVCWDLTGRDTASIDVRDKYAKIEEDTLATAVANEKAYRIYSTRHAPFHYHNSKLKRSVHHR